MLRGTMVAAGAMLALGGCSVGQAQDGGPTVQRQFAVSGFDKLEVAGPYDVTVATGGQPSAQARGAQNLLEQTVVEVKDGTLHIHPKKDGRWFGRGFNWRGGKAAFQVTVPMLTGAAVAGSGDIKVDRVQTGEFTGSVAGSGNLGIGQLQVGKLGLEIAGSGAATAAGRAGEARYEIAGSGDIDAGGLQVERLKAEIAGSGNIKAHASASADVDIAGSGDVEVTGGAKCNVSKAGSGDVRCS
ncbi:DUF2807 domain-containing protein [Sphingomonas sp. BN140010]|uniref:DUF2807 domain-containing protein n=1 Tax=Sphingomonas arvum TaxID=2992113 RepID=A0ABT3JFP1_9SPHN|nr:head GIN domain-containing protein [Sphingomonas sp. BN140010]MCW3797898.1 DUF2807 domain-containing protein [Sphingomonas sp. BN140010]